MKINHTEIILQQGDITIVSTDAIVNAANSSLMGGGGVDGAIHRAGGPQILSECRKIRETRYRDGMPAGEAVITTAGDLPARWVIHTVGPVWHGGAHGEAEILYSAYTRSLEVASKAGAQSIAFPSISTGAYGYPIELAAEVALSAIIHYARDNNSFEEIRMVLFGQHAFKVYQKAMETAIDER